MLIRFWLILLLSTPLLFGDKKPNILLFIADDMTWTDLGCYGNPDVKTPNLDALAKSGIRFTRCFSSAPTCSPCRQSLYTGLYPVRNGAHPNHSRVHENVKALPSYLSALGYRCMLVGKRHEAPASIFSFEQLGGMHHDSGKPSPQTELPIHRAKAVIDQLDDQPWCLVVASNQPHTPWNRGDASRYDAKTLTIPNYLVDTPNLRTRMTHYYAEISYMDAQVGQALKLADDNTCVLWLSEQGSQFPFGKWTCYNNGIHAAAIASWPGVVKPERTTDALISYVDILPTFIDIAGGQADSTKFDGRSFASVLRGESDQHHRYVFAMNTTRGIINGSKAFASRAVTDGEWLFIHNLHSDETFTNMVTRRDTTYHGWKTMSDPFAQSRYRLYQHRPPYELFRLDEDPDCLNNLAEAPNAALIRIRLSGKLAAWMKQQGDHGDQTEREAMSRQPKQKPWVSGGSYYPR